MDRWMRFRQFLSATLSELKKTTWPGRSEVYGTTMVVIIFVLICASYLWVVDIFLQKGMSKIFEVFR